MRRLLILVLVLSLAAVACSDDGTTAASTTGSPQTGPVSDNGGTGDGLDSSSATTSAPAGSVIVFNGQGNNLVAYSADPPFEHQTVITNASEDPEARLDINAQICFFEEDGSTYFVAGEDTRQDQGRPQGWGMFRLEGTGIGDLAATEVGRLVPTFQEGSQPENYGCGRLSDGRLLTTDIGNQALGEGTGQLIIWFPPFDSEEVRYCKLDVQIGTAQSIWVDPDDNVYVASARGWSEQRPAGVYRYSPPFPTGDDAEGGCEGTDATGAPMASEVSREVFIPTDAENGLGTPSGIAASPSGGLFVSSVFTGVINEYDSTGVFVRTILEPPEGEELGADPYSTGTPLGIGVAPDGTLYYADIGIVVPDGGTPGPGAFTGSVRRITFDRDGNPRPPEVMADGLPFPDGIGLLVL